MSNNLPPPPKSTAPPVLPPGVGGPLPPNVTPGWNDPPELSSSSPSSGPKRLLNKRVAFPMTPAPQSPQSTTMTPLSANDTTYNEIINNFTMVVNQLPDNAVLKKDMDRLPTNWKDIATNQEVKLLLLLASRFVKDGDVEQGEGVHKELSMLPAAGWFTLFLHSIIMALSSQKNNEETQNL